MALSFIVDLQDGRYLWAGHIQSIAQALRGRYVVDGCKVVPGVGLDVSISAGKIYYIDGLYDVAGGTLTLASNTNNVPRADLIVWNGDTQNLEILQGTDYWTDGTNYYPIAPLPADNHVLLALVVVRNGATSILPDDIYDLRVSGEYSTNRLINLAFDDTQASAVGSAENEVKTFRFAKSGKYMNLNKLYIVASLWTSSGGYARLRVYIDGNQYLELGTSNTIETVLTGSIDVSGLTNGMHSVSIRILNDVSTATTYHQYLNVLGDV